MIDGGDQPTLSYDANSNLVSYKGWVYRYDAQNRLIYASNGTTSATFYYDGKNRQTARNINGVIRFNSWDGWELLEEYSSSLNVATAYLQGSTGVIKSWSAANTLYYYQDKLGSTTQIANVSGQLVESYKYDLYGTPSYFNSTSQPLNSSTVAVTDLYAGERWIPELALYDLRNRFMSPELGRFLQPDPIGFKGDASNLYRYCGNDPVDRTDPDGLYGKAPGEWNEKEWQKYEAAQKADIKMDKTAKAEIDHTLTGAKDKVAEAVVKAFKKELGSADPAKMQKVSQDLTKKLAALEDNGSHGYWAHPTTDQKLLDMHLDPKSVVAYTHRWDKNIYVNVGQGWSHSALTWAVEHESGHSAAGFCDWSYVSQNTWRNNAMSYPQRMTNADTQTALAHDIAGEH